MSQGALAYATTRGRADNHFTFSLTVRATQMRAHYADASTDSIVCIIETVSSSGMSGLSNNPL